MRNPKKLFVQMETQEEGLFHSADPGVSKEKRGRVDCRPPPMKNEGYKFSLQKTESMGVRLAADNAS